MNGYNYELIHAELKLVIGNTSVSKVKVSAKTDEEYLDILKHYETFWTNSSYSYPGTKQMVIVEHIAPTQDLISIRQLGKAKELSSYGTMEGR